MIQKYSLCLPREMNGLEAYNYCKKWLSDILKHSKTGQKVSDFKFTKEGKRLAVFRIKKSSL